MTITAHSGALGTYPDSNNPQYGPVFGQHGHALLDVRSQFTYTPGQAAGKPVYMTMATQCVAIDAVPSAIAANNIAASQSPGTSALTLVSSSGAGITVGVTITNALTQKAVTGLLAIDGAAGSIAYGTDGTVQLYDPSKMLARAVRITSGGNDSGITFTVRGYDVYGFPMSEVITGANAGVASGAKAFKYIASITPSASVATTVTVGTSDIYGFPLLANTFGFTTIFWNSASVTASTGFTGAVTTTATGTTGDVRGTYATQSASDGTKRLTIFISLSPANALTSAGTYGVTQFSN